MLKINLDDQHTFIFLFHEGVGIGVSTISPPVNMHMLHFMFGNRGPPSLVEKRRGPERFSGLTKVNSRVRARLSFWLKY